jgi:hypothetical protein
MTTNYKTGDKPFWIWEQNVLKDTDKDKRRLLL